MPCNCDHLEPNSTERRVSKIACLLDEFDGKTFNSSYWNGMHPSVYSQTYDKYAGEFSEIEMLKDLVERIALVDVTFYSLEMQMWWRDYLGKFVEAEKVARLEAAKEEVRKVALKKLSAKERSALGVD